jgi:hypothetical protein
MVSVASTYIGAADDVAAATICRGGADTTARTANHRNALYVRSLELSQGREGH